MSELWLVRICDVSYCMLVQVASNWQALAGPLRTFSHPASLLGFSIKPIYARFLRDFLNSFTAVQVSILLTQ